MKRRQFNKAAAAVGAATAFSPLNVRAQAQKLKVGVLLPRPASQAGIGQDCQRGVDLAPACSRTSACRHRDHERRHGVERRHRALARRAPDQRRRQRAGRRLRFRPDHRHRAGRRAARHAAGDQHRRRAADHRAGLQVRVPQLPDGADDPRRRPSPIRRAVRDDRRRAEDRGVHARQRHLRPRRCQGLQRRHAEASADAVQDRRHHRLRPGGARPVGRGVEGQGDGADCAAAWSAA